MSTNIADRILKVFQDKKLLARQDYTGVSYANGKFVLYPGMCCCGLVALLLDKECEESDEVENLEAMAVKYLGLHPGYAEGFIHGFDGETAPHDPENEYAEGFEDGRSTWNLLVKNRRIYISDEAVEKDMAEPDYNDPQ